MVTRQTKYVLALIACIASGAAWAQAPTVIHYRGHLDVPTVVPAGTVQRDLTFNLYEVEFGGSPVWTETQTLDIYDGNFAVLLGTMNAVQPAMFAGEYRYLGVVVGSSDELTPRQRIASVPYAMQAVNSATAQAAFQAQSAVHADDADTLGGGAAYTSTQGLHLVPGGSAEKVYIDGSVDAQQNIITHGSFLATEGAYFGRSTVDTGSVVRINENDSSESHSTLDRLRVTTSRRITPYAAITLWHLVVSEDGYVGINTNNPQAPLDVNGAIYQRGSVLHADYVFEDDYEMVSIEEHAEKMWEGKHLPAVPPRKVDDEGREIIELGSQNCGILEELEIAHIYIQQLNQRIAQLEKEIRSLQQASQE